VLWQTLDLTELLSMDEGAEPASYEQTERSEQFWGLTPHFEHLSNSDWMLNRRTFGTEFNAF